MEVNTWLKSLEASIYLGVSELTLENWREIGYLKEGTHWRSISNRQISSEVYEIFYHKNWCKEEMEYWKFHDASIPYIAA